MPRDFSTHSIDVVADPRIRRYGAGAMNVTASMRLPSGSRMKAA
jgi:hypothetical protein